MVEIIGEPKMTREQFQRKMLKTMPDEARKRFEAFLAIPPEEQARIEAEREAKEREVAIQSIIANRRADTGLRGKQWRHDFATSRIVCKTDSQRIAISKAEEWVAEYPAGERGLMFWGPNGTFKDTLLDGITIAIHAKWPTHKIRKIYSLDLIYQAAAEFGRTGDKDTRIEEELMESRLVLIGDIHKLAVADKEWIRDIGLRVLDAAERIGRPLLCASTNASQKQWDIDKRIGNDFCSRVAGVFEWIEVTGPDARRSN